MRPFTRRRSLTAACSVVLVTTGLLVAPGAHAAPPDHAPAQAVGCFEDGFPPRGGIRVEGTPARYKSGNSPYLGVRFNRCANTVKVYYGGYGGRSGGFGSLFDYTYYRITYVAPTGQGWRETRQLTMGPRRVATFRPHHGDWNFRVKACRPSPFSGVFDNVRYPDECTSWSPQIFLHAV